VAVRALLSRDLDSQAVVLTGPESLSQRRQLACISSVIGRPIRVETIAEGEARAILGRWVPPSYVDLLVAQWADEVGVPAVVTDVVERVTGRPPTPYAAWVARHAEAFLPGYGNSTAGRDAATA
jgi:uncharacterized protein YbjT (DUF2867 family)